MASFFVPTRFTWQFGGQVVSSGGLHDLCHLLHPGLQCICLRWVEPVRTVLHHVGLHGVHSFQIIMDGPSPLLQVHLCGSFTRWVETVPMTPVDSRPTVFQVVVHLPPG